MPTTEELTCPKCKGEMATMFTGQRPRRRSYICSKCDTLPDPLKTPEAQGWLSSSLKPPE